MSKIQVIYKKLLDFVVPTRRRIKNKRKIANTIIQAVNEAMEKWQEAKYVEIRNNTVPSTLYGSREAYIKNQLRK